MKRLALSLIVLVTLSGCEVVAFALLTEKPQPRIPGFLNVVMYNAGYPQQDNFGPRIGDF